MTDRSPPDRGPDQSTEAGTADGPRGRRARGVRTAWRGRLARLRALVGIGVSRVRGRPSTRVIATVAGVAIAIALLVAVGAIAIGLAGETVVAGDSVDYWIVPEGSTARSVVVDVGGPRLGDTHRVTSDIARSEHVTHATPIEIAVLPVSANDTTEYAILLGVIGPPAGSDGSIGTGLSPGDPHFAEGRYDGPRTGEAVVSGATAELLDLEAGSAIRAGGDRFTVGAVDEAGLAGEFSTAPVVVVHLAELQTVTGAADGDLADRILVRATDRSVRSSIADRYPRTEVVTGAGLARQQTADSNLPLAMALAATITTLAVGVLFVATLMGLEVTADRRELAVLAAIGLSGASRAVVVGTQTLVVTAIGGVCGVLVGVVTIVASNAAVDRWLGVGPIARFDPLLVVLGLGVALAIGALAAIYPLWVARRTDPLEAMAR